MRRFVVALAALFVVFSVVPLAAAKQAPPPRNVEGSFIGTSAVGGWKAIMLFEIHAGATGTVEFGYYQYEAMTGPAIDAPARTQATVETVRFFKAKSGAAAAEFTGHECLLAVPAGNPGQVGDCPWYHVVVTDGDSVGLEDTFCGSHDTANCYQWIVATGDIRMYS